MNGKIHRVLDGELPRSALTAVELDQLATIEAAIGAALPGLPSAEPVPDMADAVMWRVAHLTPEPAPARTIGRMAAALRWLIHPQPLQLRPAAAAAVLVLALIAGGLFATRLGPAAPDETAPRLLVQFRMSLEGAREVALVGDFSGWERRYALEQVAPGVWATTIPLEPGIYDYAFVVDGERWTLDPLAPAVADGFGGANSRVAVLAPVRGAGRL